MEIGEITVSKGVTVSVGKFESIRVDASLRIGVSKEDDSDTVFTTGYELIDEQLNNQIMEIQGIIKKDSVFIVDKSTIVNRTSKTNNSRRRRRKRG